MTLNQLHDPLDKEMMRLAVEKSYDIISSPALKEYAEAKDKPDPEGILEVLKEKISIRMFSPLISPHRIY